MHNLVALFGEAEKGEFRKGYLCQDVAELADHLGEPPSEDAKGLHYAVQALLYDRKVLFFRVREEGFSEQDYLHGLQMLKNKESVASLSAIGLPGVGNSEIIDATTPICSAHRSFLILSEKDLYDYLTFRN